jgi:hypothetical protein
MEGGRGQGHLRGAGEGEGRRGGEEVALGGGEDQGDVVLGLRGVEGAAAATAREKEKAGEKTCQREEEEEEDTRVDWNPSRRSSSLDVVYAHYLQASIVTPAAENFPTQSSMAQWSSPADA